MSLTVKPRSMTRSRKSWMPIVLLAIVLVFSAFIAVFRSRPQENTRAIANMLIRATHEPGGLNILVFPSRYPGMDALHPNGIEIADGRARVYTYLSLAGFRFLRGYEIVRQPGNRSSWTFSRVYSVEGPVLKRILLRTGLTNISNAS